MAYPSGSSTAIASSHLKKQLRDVTRLIARPNLPADVRREQERKLQHLKMLLAEREATCRLSKLSKRYVKVRFFESKKAQRHVRQAARQLLAAPGEDTLAAWKEAKSDEIYVQSFPQEQKYISLWPTTPLTDAKVLTRRAAMRASLVAESGIISEQLSLEEAMAMVKSEAAKEAPTTTAEEAALEAAESVTMNKAFAAGNKRKGSAGDDDEDDEDEDEEDEEEDGDEEQDLDDEDGEDFDDEEDDDDEDGESSGADEDDDEDDEDDEDDDGEDETADEDGESSEDDDDEEDDDEEDEEDDEEEDDDEEDDDDEEEASPKKARH